MLARCRSFSHKCKIFTSVFSSWSTLTLNSFTMGLVNFVFSLSCGHCIGCKLCLLLFICPLVASLFTFHLPTGRISLRYSFSLCFVAPGSERLRLFSNSLFFVSISVLLKILSSVIENIVCFDNSVYASSNLNGRPNSSLEDDTLRLLNSTVAYRLNSLRCLYLRERFFHGR